MKRAAIYQQAEFVLSAAQLPQLPKDVGYEVAFAGRSNAGKSSVLNVLAQQNSLARTSKTPGRTQHINVFALDDERRLIDLPGYGYAKVPKKMKEEWQKTLGRYLQTRDCLRGIILIMDVRHPLKEFDCLLLDWAYNCNINMHVLLNKSDKLKKGPASKTLLSIKRYLEQYKGLMSVQLFSALKKTGLEDCYGVLDCWLALENNEDG
jgi:GTP-binding protein